jgi:FixJ family two-component response regulator
MQPEQLTVYIVDDDPAIRDSLSLMLGLAGYKVALFADAESFLAACQPDWAGCVIADLRLPGRSGIELQAELRNRNDKLHFVIITAHGDVATARTAFQARAVDFLEKPFDHAELIEAIESAFTRTQRRVELDLARDADEHRLAMLTEREREVLRHVAQGLHAKEIARALDISSRTVEVHKAHIMGKLGVRTVAELVRLTVVAEQHAQARHHEQNTSD